MPPPPPPRAVKVLPTIELAPDLVLPAHAPSAPLRPRPFGARRRRTLRFAGAGVAAGLAAGALLLHAGSPEPAPPPPATLAPSVTPASRAEPSAIGLPEPAAAVALPAPPSRPILSAPRIAPVPRRPAPARKRTRARFVRGRPRRGAARLASLPVLGPSLAVLATHGLYLPSWIRYRLRHAAGELERCWGALAGDPAEARPMGWRMHVSPRGRVESVAPTDTAIAGTRLDRCMRAALARIAWGPTDNRAAGRVDMFFATRLLATR